MAQSVEPSRRYLRIGIFALLAMALLGLGVTLSVLELQTASTAYIAGEGHWSKAQKDAVHHLYRYAESGSAEELAAVRRSLAVPLGDRKARLALEADPPDIGRARQGFREGGNAEADLDRLIRLYRHFSWAPFFREAIEKWRAGDEGILRLQALADEAEAAHRAGPPPALARVADLQERALALGNELDPLEVAFSASMQQGVQRLHGVLMLFSVAFVLLMAWAGINLLHWMQHRVSDSEGRFRAAFDQAVVGMLKLNAEGLVLEANDTFGRLLGMDARSLRQRPLSELVDAEDWEPLCIGKGGRPRWSAFDEPRESRFIRADGAALWCRWTASRYAYGKSRDDDVLMIVEDVSEARALEADMLYQASHDALTDLPNRREIERQLQIALDQACGQGREHTFCFLDLDQFKLINDTSGHVVGDQLLCQIAGMLPLGLRPTDLVGRLGGDEFAILLRDTPLTRGLQIAESLRVNLEQMPTANGQGFGVTASIGVVGIDSETPSVDWLLKATDSACYLAKDDGRNCVRRYQESDEAVTRRRNEMEWVSEIRSALDAGRLELYAQRLDVVNGSGMQYEVLVRLRGEDGRIYSPGAFLPAAERYHQGMAIDRYVVSRLFDELGTQIEHLRRLELCHVNVSGQSITQPSFREFVAGLLRQHPAIATRLCFEITETAVVSNLLEATAFIETVRAEGCRVALDDFGSGLSSFGYLKNLDIDVLKLDQIFVRELGRNPVDEALVRLICQVGHTLGKTVVAEGAETSAAVGVLREIGVDAIQGFAIHRPCPLSEMFLPGNRPALRIVG
ncbi:MAG: EAL domain-containing protein [Lysobacteraceae bacterium]